MLAFGLVGLGARGQGRQGGLAEAQISADAISKFSEHGLVDANPFVCGIVAIILKVSGK